MKHDIYFHNDFDGRASAAVVLSFLRSRGDDIGHYVPVNYHLLPQWLDEKFFEKHKLFKGKRNPAIIVDFLYHPKAAFWFDHHPTSIKKESWRKAFKKSKYRNWNSSYQSCCHWTYAALKKNFGWKPPKHFADFVKWADVIDGANYRSAKQSIDMKEPALQINNFVEEHSGEVAMAEETIKFLAERTMAEFVKQPYVKKAVAELRRRTKIAVDFYRKNLVIDGRVMIIDLTKAEYEAMAHFAPYYLHPKMLYSIRFSPRHNLFHMNVGVNPWLREKNKVHIGELLRHYGGGGHMGVGGVEFTTKKESVKAITEITARLNGKG